MQGTKVAGVTHEWDAATYDALPLPHERWGARTLERLPLRGDEHVLDAGCGTGRDTALLLERLPAGRVTAVDASSTMLERLKSRLGDRLDRVDVIEADLTRPLPLRAPVDAVFSCAAFHWIADHQALFDNLAGVTRAHGRIVAECGGEGNIAKIAAAITNVLGPTSDVWNFAGEAETRERLRRAGFEDVEVSLIPDPARFAPGEEFETYLATVVLGSHLDRIPEADRATVVHQVADRLDEPVVDYVRLSFSGVKA
ncbi:MAG: class I SAM-dependent methyltransferase [Actinomycetota bacterium]